jgi:hypothetical protein
MLVLATDLIWGLRSCCPKKFWESEDSPQAENPPAETGTGRSTGGTNSWGLPGSA